jgi:hypothetical protein
VKGDENSPSQDTEMLEIRKAKFFKNKKMHLATSQAFTK